MSYHNILAHPHTSDLCLAGVRFPSVLLPEVVATLAIQAQLATGQGSWSALGQKVEPIDPIAPRSRAKAFK